MRKLFLQDNEDNSMMRSKYLASVAMVIGLGMATPLAAQETTLLQVSDAPRYQIVTADGGGVLLLDRETGDTWQLQNRSGGAARWVEVEFRSPSIRVYRGLRRELVR